VPSVSGRRLQEGSPSQLATRQVRASLTSSARRLAAGVFGFLGMSITRSQQDGLGVTAAVGHSAKDALRLAWVVLKGA